jgi:hypothetical protein
MTKRVTTKNKRAGNKTREPKEIDKRRLKALKAKELLQEACDYPEASDPQGEAKRKRIDRVFGRMIRTAPALSGTVTKEGDVYKYGLKADGLDKAWAIFIKIYCEATVDS